MNVRVNGVPRKSGSDKRVQTWLGSGLSSEATLGVTAALGMAAYQRDRIVERARGLLDREE